MKKTIKTLFMLTLAVGVISLNSCKKDKKDPEVSITASVDGKATTFNTGAAALTATVGDSKITNIEGTAADGTTISIAITGAVTAGKTYSNTAANDNDKPLMMFSTADEDYMNDDSNTANPATLTITSVTSTSIEGTFSGGLVATDFNPDVNTTATTKAITNGKFFVKIQTAPTQQ